MTEEITRFSDRLAGKEPDGELLRVSRRTSWGRCVVGSIVTWVSTS